MIGFIILVISAFYKAFTGECFITDIDALGVASLGELILEIFLGAVCIGVRQ